MKTLLALFTLALLTISATPKANAEEMMMHPTKKLVVFYADYCGQCKILEPKMMKALEQIDGDSYKMVKFDYTSRETIMDSKELAQEEGVSDLQKSYGAKTGFAVIADERGKEIALISANKSADEIVEILQNALNS